MNRENVINLTLKQEEIDELSAADALLYVRYHHEKKHGLSSVLFAGFSEQETKKLIAIANASSLTINSKISSGLTFFCVSEKVDQKRIKTAQEYGTIILTKNIFEELFFQADEYLLQSNQFIYDRSISADFRIAKPLSNFDRTLQVKSFSFDSDEIYSVNLHALTCTCLDFEKKNRILHKKGDIRRLCKHLMFEYKSRFGLVGLSKFKTYLFQQGIPIKDCIKTVEIEKINDPVIINFDAKDDWWNIYILNKGLYSKYGYHPIEERFSYDDKPHGYVTVLKAKLKEVKLEFGIINRTDTKKNPQTHDNSNYRSVQSKAGSKATNSYQFVTKTSNSNQTQQPKGCLVSPLVVIVVSIVIYLLLR